MKRKINLAIINSTQVKLSPYTKQGTEIFDYIFINGLYKYKRKEFDITAFCSGNSLLPVKKESVIFRSSLENQHIGAKHHLIFDLALISKAIGMQNKFDIFHSNIGSGDYMMAFAQFIKKPIVNTIHGVISEPHSSLFFSQFERYPHLYFTPISNYQKKSLPSLNFTRTIYHGIDPKKYSFNAIGGKNIVWTGRAVPEKGLDTVLTIAQKLKKYTRVFPIIKDEYLHWVYDEIIKKRDLIIQIVKVYIEFNMARSGLITEYQNSKLFLFPLRWDEPFGLTLIESMSCGTPIVTYARGSIPEIVKDGETGFIVNPSDDDIRGNWIIKKTGIEGLCEAVERIYAMPEDQYKKMRLACRAHVEKNFTVEHMVDQYVEVYKEILAKKASA
ncbi:hypothetical protein COY90_04925 [Candidatus Roizmanbacteria bacterium CG_4_10_14_0_8_um_filter_39_9]|uniref:Glycosyl transferase family 1 domain-containing protein n=1 Tax=Candidatus Roizmanbacteria bacterium CG_4_10_14_0_8_um_filter_39_9 TaxID=1974829 RepID=A0A2M7QBL7_9BACT|nr:MAG: hypothetical protein COY90_04925 [Candidatus Roizmanbacteria bacterium CG_4_10_14_0_8_um_filter_39_9]